MSASDVLIGMNIRPEPGVPDSVLHEIAFAHSAGFDSVQFAVRAPGDYAAVLGTPLPILAEALRTAQLISVMELVVRIDASGKNALGQTPLEALQAQLPVITALPCACVHWHLVPQDFTLSADTLMAQEDSLLTQFTIAVELAATHGLHFGFEHNEPAIPLFATPERCARMLDAVPGLGVVWDLNHTISAHLEGFLQLTPRMTMLHVSDTPLPEVNHHLPLGRGNIDFAGYCRALLAGGFSGPAILEVGGLPKSGGYGQDTDAALLESRRRFADALAMTESAPEAAQG